MTNITPAFARSFAEEWISSWNSHNIDIILNHYSQDFIIESPLAAVLIPTTSGRVIGKDAVREYWTIGLNRNPNLEFKILDVLIGIDGLTIYHEDAATKKRAIEMMIFNEEGEVQKAFVHHIKD
jgi:hypothetical protein